MNQIDYLAQKIEVIKAIPDDKIQSPVSVPVKVYIQEAEYMYKWCQPDKEMLMANHLDWSLVEDIPARVRILRDMQSLWAVSDSTDAEIEKQWEAKHDEAVKLRKHIVRSLKFVFNGNKPMITKIRKHGKGSSANALIQSLNDLSAFGMEHKDFLTSQHFNISLLDTAAEMSDILGDLNSSVKVKRGYYSGSRKIRDQAYTHLKEAIDELKRHAEYVLVGREDRLKGYASEYNRKRYFKMKQKNKAAEDQQDSPKEE
ncbi:MAG TPA: hypothetical protein P5120_19320 [Spirochaetota bacterium]|nr:hypothetical protein [Spirochaetota bacterium]HPJ44325.1 hypothetical protein [Spirochaetota bacterium]HPR39363.1 hypothetical protein [Spirochaetota bacterium]HRX49684.1 hypothetical protein [Spirochaetota bacterium]